MLPFANYTTNSLLQWLGIIIFYMGVFLLYQSHSDLGKNWNPEVALNEKQILIHKGVYKRIRHPMYTAHVLWAIGNTLIFSNWIVGPAMLVTTILFLPQRIKREERFLIEVFGEEYTNYIKKTGSLFPKF